jgi:extracellular factor (EF) 3-hydroxypalmitic acid methyl ester biosynthesis protein
MKSSLMVCRNGQGEELHAPLVRVTRYAAVFEVYDPGWVFRVSESLNGFSIVFQDRTVYSGRAVVRNLLNVGSETLCEVTLDETAWMELEVTHELIRSGKLRAQFSEFIQGWQKLYRVLPEYQLAVADLQSFLTDLKLSLDQMELGIRAMSPQARSDLEEKVALEMQKAAAPMFSRLFEQFEAVAQKVDRDLLPAHFTYARRQLHPLVSVSPFFYRCFNKPLGYAGDYEMVNMMLRNPCEGASLFAKVLNLWFLAQPPVVAHRNRIDHLVRQLVLFSSRMAARRQPPRIVSIGCGPAQEVQRFLMDHEISGSASVSLLDFNEETLRFTGSMLSSLAMKHQRRTTFRCIRKSVHHLLKEAGRKAELPSSEQYDLVYCAGLLDYLSNPVSDRLIDVLYEWVAPGGQLLVTNVAAHNPSRGWMEHVTDWHLIYRDARQMAELSPKKAEAGSARVVAELSGVNIFMEVEKPAHA